MTVIDYWFDIIEKDLDCFTDKDSVRNIFVQFYNVGELGFYELEGRKGVIAYCVAPDMLGGHFLAELIMYIKPEYRGDLRLFKKLVTHMEEKAKELGLKKLKIGSNIGYNDEVVLKVLQRWGYRPDILVKEV